MGLAWEKESLDAYPFDKVEVLVLLCLADASCEAGDHCADDFLLNPGPGSLEM